jgi:precorrin-6B methylase 2
MILSEPFNELKNRVGILAGALLLISIGRDRFYRLAQEPTGLLPKVASFFCQGHVARLVNNYQVMQEGKQSEGISSIAKKYYSDDSLHGYGDPEFARGEGKPLEQQQRALILPLVDRAIEQVIPSSGKATVVEIGTANGDVSAHLARAHSDTTFIGVDFSVRNAETKHRLENLQFVEGYALDLLKGNKLTGDIVFSSSSFCVFTPKELEAYLANVRKAGFRQIVLSDPVVCGFKHVNDDRAISRHMDLYMWWHNYAGYLRHEGYEIIELKTTLFSYGTKDVPVILIRAGLPERT